MRSLLLSMLLLFPTSVIAAKPDATLRPLAGKWISDARLGGLGGLIIREHKGKWTVTRLVSGPDDGLIEIATVPLRQLRDDIGKNGRCGFAVFRIVKSVTYTVVWQEKQTLIAEEVILDPSPGTDRRVRFVLKRQSAP